MFRFNVFTGTLDLVGASGGGSSGVNGIAPTTPGAIATWVDTGATTIQNTQTNVQASGAIEAQGYITRQDITGTVAVNQDECWIAPALNLTLTGAIDLTGGGSLAIVT
jgi:hypothetical protein